MALVKKNNGQTVLSNFFAEPDFAKREHVAFPKRAFPENGQKHGLTVFLLTKLMALGRSRTPRISVNKASARSLGCRISSAALSLGGGRLGARPKGL